MLNRFIALFKNKIAKNAAWLIGGNIANKLLAFVVGVCTARYLGPGNYGLINYAAAYTTFFFSLASLGMNSIIVKKLIDNPNQQDKIMGTTLLLQGASGLLSAFIILLIATVIDAGETLTIAVVFLCSLGLFFQELDSIKYWFQSRLQSKYAAIATTIAYIVTSLYRVLLLAFGKSVVWFAIATSIDYFCVAVFLFIAYRKENGPKLRFSWITAKDLLNSSYHYILSGLMVSIYGATDKLMLKHMLNEESVGLYGTAVTISSVWVFVLAAIIDSLNPIIMELHNTDTGSYRKKNVQLYRMVFYLSLIVSTVITVFADLGVNLMYGEAYAGAVIPLQVITWYVAFSYLGVARNAWVVCENQQKHLTPIYIGAAVINVILNYLLIPLLGATGAAIASLMTQICTIFIIPLFIKSMRPNVKLMLDAVLFRKVRKEDK